MSLAVDGQIELVDQILLEHDILVARAHEERERSLISDVHRHDRQPITQEIALAFEQVIEPETLERLCEPGEGGAYET